ncbi:hypothetical protein [Lichenihabitans psoromatis]|uniref:hypothetical protein n=1 Tax=Lichenihabitans psoromatis TaxID=2528642 RepID=UPI001035CE0C|nr:hypothetical protein [Lichenihabitans psoromatis]
MSNNTVPVNVTGLPSTRRSFLSGLASLPLIGGGLTLIGNPTAVAVPVTPDLLDSYDTWLSLERDHLRFERYSTQENSPLGSDFEIVYRNRSTGDVFDYVLMGNAGSRRMFSRPAPSTRAAVVLSAAGIHWVQA